MKSWEERENVGGRREKKRERRRRWKKKKKSWWRQKWEIGRKRGRRKVLVTEIGGWWEKEREREEEKRRRTERQAETDKRGSSGYLREFRLTLWCRQKPAEVQAGVESRCKRYFYGSSSVGRKNKALWMGLNLYIVIPQGPTNYLHSH